MNITTFIVFQQHFTSIVMIYPIKLFLLDKYGFQTLPHSSPKIPQSPELKLDAGNKFTKPLKCSFCIQLIFLCAEF